MGVENSKTGKKIEKDANEKYLTKYYQNGSPSNDFIAEYKELGVLCQKFSKLFLDKEYKKASKILLEIKDKFMKIGEYADETIY
ncbi:hypothetical protein OKW23_000421 [Bacilli bacterium PM5-9]|nr:hypothetical protein [Bacilli bacterium PM5-9]